MQSMRKIFVYLGAALGRALTFVLIITTAALGRALATIERPLFAVGVLISRMKGARWECIRSRRR